MLQSQSRKKKHQPPGSASPWDGIGRQFVLSLQKKLLWRALTPWPRRPGRLLAINCGDGAFLPMLWKSGFDVSATEADGELRSKAMARNVPAVEIDISSDDALGFEDEAFDWVILHMERGRTNRLPAATREAMRLARKGLMLTFWNRCSLAGLLWRIRRRQNSCPLFSWWQVWHGLELAAHRQGLSTLCGPPATWRADCRVAFLNACLARAPFGAWCIVRAELGRRLVTPLSLRIARSISLPKPAMEYSPKNMSNHT